MSGTFPTAGFTTLNYNNNVTVRQTESVNGRTQRSKTGGQYWSFTLESPPLERAAFNAIYSFIVQQDGSFESFTISPPVVGSTAGTASGNLVTKEMSTAQKQKGSSTIKFGNKADGSPVTGTLKVGDFFKLASHDKVYMIVGSDITFDGSTSPEVSIYPPLVQTIDNSDDVTYNSVPFKVHFTSDRQSYTVDPSLLYTYQIEVREQL
tara:strand:- start:264 stop:884 length:621 start_codon:yes stop_codon:yes gene_type:complete